MKLNETYNPFVILSEMDDSRTGKYKKKVLKEQVRKFDEMTRRTHAQNNN